MSPEIKGSPNFHKAVTRYEQLLQESRRELKAERRQRAAGRAGRAATSVAIAVTLFAGLEACRAWALSASESDDPPVVVGRTLRLADFDFEAVSVRGARSDDEERVIVLIGADGLPRGWVREAEFWEPGRFDVDDPSVEKFVLNRLRDGMMSVGKARSLLASTGRSRGFLEAVERKLGMAIETGQFADGVPPEVFFRLDRGGQSWVRW